MYGLYSRAASNQERPMMARIRYVHCEMVENKVELGNKELLGHPKTVP